VAAGAVVCLVPEALPLTSRITALDDLADRAAVGARIVDAAAVTVARSGLAEIGEPEAAALVEDEIVRTAQRVAVALCIGDRASR